MARCRGLQLRRFGRLYPLLVFSTVMWILAANGLTFAKIQMVARGMGGALKNADKLAYAMPTVGEVAATLTMTHALGLFDTTILNFVSWSISVEFWAYALFAVLMLTVPPARRTAVFAGVAAAAFGVAVWASVGKHACLARGQCLALTYDFSYQRCIASFLLGVLVWQYRGRWRRAERPAQLASLAAVLALLAGLDRLPALAFAFPFVFAGLIWSMAMDTGPLARALAGSFGKSLGEKSYSIYMLHPILIMGFFQLVQRFPGPAAGMLIVAGYVGTLLLVSGWTYRYIEVPARNYFNGVAKRVNEEPPGSVQAAR